MGRNSNYNNPNWRPDTTDVWSFQETLHERNGRAVAAGETWQVGSDIVEVLGKAAQVKAVQGAPLPGTGDDGLESKGLTAKKIDEDFVDPLRQSFERLAKAAPSQFGHLGSRTAVRRSERRSGVPWRHHAAVHCAEYRQNSHPGARAGPCRRRHSFYHRHQRGGR